MKLEIGEEEQSDGEASLSYGQMADPCPSDCKEIIIAEDQPINVQCIKYQLEELGILNICDFCFNGEETVRLI